VSESPIDSIGDHNLFFGNEQYPAWCRKGTAITGESSWGIATDSQNRIFL
jgi:hypothetical protein